MNRDSLKFPFILFLFFSMVIWSLPIQAAPAPDRPEHPELRPSNNITSEIEDDGIEHQHVIADYFVEDRFGGNEIWDLRWGTGVHYIAIKDVPIGLFMNDSGYVDPGKKYCATNPAYLYVYRSEEDLNGDGVVDYRDVGHWTDSDARLDIMISGLEVNDGGVLSAKVDYKFTSSGSLPTRQSLEIFFDRTQFKPCVQFPQIREDGVTEGIPGGTPELGDAPIDSEPYDSGSEFVAQTPQRVENPTGIVESSGETELSGEGGTIVLSEVQSGDDSIAGNGAFGNVQGGSRMGCSLTTAAPNFLNGAALLWFLPLLFGLISKHRKK